MCNLICSNGMTDTGETCDDGNTANSDGCSSTCAVETNYACTGTPSVCVITCPNGVIGVGETCDDNNGASGDGCSSLCSIEAGYICTG